MSEERLKKIKDSLDIQDIYGDYNETTKELYNEVIRLREENKKIQQQHLETINKLIETQQRKEKAVEYIEQFCDRNEEVIDAFNFDYSYNHIIDILNGRSDE